MPVCRRLVSEAHVVDAWLELRALIYLQAKVVRKRPEPSLVKTFVVGLYCGAAHHDVAFVGHGVIVRLFDFDAPKYYLRSVPVGTEEEHRRR